MLNLFQHLHLFTNRNVTTKAVGILKQVQDDLKNGNKNPLGRPLLGGKPLRFGNERCFFGLVGNGHKFQFFHK